MTKNRIAELRREAEMNQRELGDKLGVAQTTVSAWETGKNEPDNESMNTMAKLFHVSIGYLAGYEHDEKYRGLSPKEYDEFVVENMAKHDEEKTQKKIDRYIQSGDESTDEDIDEYEEMKEWQEWEQSGKNVFFEVYKINRLCESLNMEQRKRALKMIELMFPNAKKGKPTVE